MARNRGQRPAQKGSMRPPEHIPRWRDVFVLAVSGAVLCLIHGLAGDQKAAMIGAKRLAILVAIVCVIAQLRNGSPWKDE